MFSVEYNNLEINLHSIVEILCVFFYIPIILFWLCKHYFYLKLKKNDIFYPLLCVIISQIILFFVCQKFYMMKIFPFPEILTTLSILMLMLSILIDAIALTQLIINFNLKQKNTFLIINGIYRYFKHPIYLSHLNFCFFAFILNGTILTALALILWIFAYPLIRTVEEKELTLRFGQVYIDYAKNKLL
ncbi:MAG: methyltransferase [Candidatus Anstonellales archaeon]